MEQIMTTRYVIEIEHVKGARYSSVLELEEIYAAIEEALKRTANLDKNVKLVGMNRMGPPR